MENDSDFDKWYKEKYGQSFESVYGQSYMMWHDYFRALSKYLKEYVCETLKKEFRK